MSISDITISGSVRNKLLVLQKTETQIASVQIHLATGKKVSSALDNAHSFFASAGFLQKANDLTIIKQGLMTANQTLRAASNALNAIAALAEQMQGVIGSALETSDNDTRVQLLSQFATLREQLEDLALDARFNGTNLINGTGVNLQVLFNEAGTSSLTVSSIDATADGLGLPSAAAAFVDNDSLKSAQASLKSAVTDLRTHETAFGNHVGVILARNDFADTFINTLQTAADNLVLADIDEEGAKLQALQARNQLAMTTLATSSDQRSITQFL